MAKKGIKKPDPIDLPVEFGGVSIGDGVGRLGVKLDRSVISVSEAVRVFCGHRLSGRVTLGNGDSPGQQRMVDDLDHVVDGTFDVKRIGVSVKQISTSLTFNLADIDVAELAKLSKGSGRLRVTDVLELPEPEKSGPDSGSGDEGFDDDEDKD